MSNIIIGLGEDLTGRVVKARSIVNEPTGIQRLSEISTCTTFAAGMVSEPGAGANLPKIYSIHPDFPNMSCESVQVTGQYGGLAEITAQYVGFLAESATFYWPPTSNPAFSGSLAGSPSVVPNIKFFPAGEKVRSVMFPSSGDWAHFPIIVQIQFIDSIDNEEDLYSNWRLNTTEMPSDFRGVKLPTPEKSPYRIEPPAPPEGFTGTLYGFIYYGVVLSGLSVTRRGKLYNEVIATFKDKFQYNTYAYTYVGQP